MNRQKIMAGKVLVTLILMFQKSKLNKPLEWELS